MSGEDDIEKLRNIVDNLDDLIGTFKESENIHDVINKLRDVTTDNINIDVEDRLGELVEYDDGVEIRQRLEGVEDDLSNVRLLRSGNKLSVRVLDKAQTYEFDLPEDSYDLERSGARIRNGVLTVRIPREDRDFDFEVHDLGGDDGGG